MVGGSGSGLVRKISYQKIEFVSEGSVTKTGFNARDTADMTEYELAT